MRDAHELGPRGKRGDALRVHGDRDEARSGSQCRLARQSWRTAHAESTADDQHVTVADPCARCARARGSATATIAQSIEQARERRHLAINRGRHAELVEHRCAPT